jgi:hypothetical protein
MVCVQRSFGLTCYYSALRLNAINGLPKDKHERNFFFVVAYTKCDNKFRGLIAVPLEAFADCFVKLFKQFNECIQVSIN